MPVTRRRRIAAELCEHVELSKDKLQNLSSLVDSLIIVIQELDDAQFDNLNKETVIGVIQQEIMQRHLPRRQLPPTTTAQATTAQVDNCPGKTTAQVGQLPR